MKHHLPRPPSATPERSASPPRGDGGFSLLEVLIALSVLAILGTVTLRGVHQTQDILFEDDWRDRAVRMGRNLLYEANLGAKAAGTSGTFAPRYPEIHWRLVSREFSNGQGAFRVFEIFEKKGTRRHEIRLESFNAVYLPKDDAQ